MLESTPTETIREDSTHVSFKASVFKQRCWDWFTNCYGIIFCMTAVLWILSGIGLSIYGFICLGGIYEPDHRQITKGCPAASGTIAMFSTGVSLFVSFFVILACTIMCKGCCRRREDVVVL